MRNIFAFLLVATAICLPVHAHVSALKSTGLQDPAPPPTVQRVDDSTVKFEGVQERCVRVGKVKFGANAHWSDCSVTKGRWFATLDHIDMYQAQYCLSKGAGECDQRAFLVFANRAYTPNAQVILQRLDRGLAEYDDPLLIQTKYGSVLTLSARFPDGSASKSYYRWKTGRWVSLNASDWLRDLSKQLPKSETIKGDVWPDVDSMSAQATLYHKAGDSQVQDRIAQVELALSNDRFNIKKVTLVRKAD